jgi:hypothetical protein
VGRSIAEPQLAVILFWEGWSQRSIGEADGCDYMTVGRDLAEFLVLIGGQDEQSQSRQVIDLTHVFPSTYHTVLLGSDSQLSHRANCGHDAKPGIPCRGKSSLESHPCDEDHWVSCHQTTAIDREVAQG